MLIDDKITAILAGENTDFNNYLDKFQEELELNGLVTTRNLIITDILYYLLNQDFSHTNINLELYKKLNHLKELFDTHSLTTIVPSTTTTTTPTITVNSPTTLSFGTMQVGETKTLYTTFSASSLTTMLQIIAPTSCTISLDPTDNFTGSIGILPINGNIGTTTLYVKYTPTSQETYTGSVSLESTGATSKTISCTATTLQVELTVSKTNISFDEVNINTTSSEDSFVVTGTYLLTDIIITATTGFEVSLTSGSGFSNTVTVTKGVGTTTATIYCRFNPTIVQMYVSTITATTTGHDAEEITVDGEGVQAYFTALPTNINFGSVNVDERSSDSYFDIEGEYLLDDVDIVCDDYVYVTLTSGSGYTQSLSLTPSSGSVLTRVYVSFLPTTSGVYTDTITCTSPTATTRTINISGVGVGDVWTYSTPGISDWVCPEGVTTVKVECIGAGGAGSNIVSGYDNGGGAGGCYASSNITVIPGNTYKVSVASQTTTNTATDQNVVGSHSYGEYGQSSSFYVQGGTTHVLAWGGASAYEDQKGLGDTYGCIGTIQYKGGDGSNSGITYTGAGGGAGGESGNGGNASTSTAGTGNGTNSGDGGTGLISLGIGDSGDIYGGAGSGAYTSSSGDRAFGYGAQGVVIITSYVP